MSAVLSTPLLNHSGGIVVNKGGLPHNRPVCTVGRMGLGANVKRRREQLNLTQADLAERSGVNQQTISALESRDSRTSGYLLPLATALGLKSDQLLSGHWPQSARLSPEIIPQHDTSTEDQTVNVQKEINELVSAWLALPENERYEVKQQIEVRSLKYRKRVPDQQMESYGKKAKTKATGTQ